MIEHGCIHPDIKVHGGPMLAPWTLLSGHISIYRNWYAHTHTWYSRTNEDMLSVDDDEKFGDVVVNYSFKSGAARVAAVKWSDCPQLAGNQSRNFKIVMPITSWENKCLWQIWHRFYRNNKRVPLQRGVLQRGLYLLSCKLIHGSHICLMSACNGPSPIERPYIFAGLLTGDCFIKP